MALLSLFTLAALYGWISQSAVAIQVTPNSPCSNACVDSPGLDLSDPNSSNTKGSDILCQDAKFGNTAAGIKWQSCMSCLQNSTFSQGTESDEMWFLYNMRFSLAFCIFNFLNSTSVGDSPCVTSYACGPVYNALKSDVLSPQTVTPYGYCSVDNGATTHENLFRCGSCVKSTDDSMYLTNYVVALDAGCQQKPEAGHTLGLSGSVFSPTLIGIVDPSTIVPSNPSSGSKSSGLSTAAIAGIVVAIIVLLLIIAAVLFIRHKKRENRRKRASYESKANTPWHITSSQMPTSPLSFQCATQLGNNGPASPKFFPESAEEKETDGSSYSPDSSPNLSRKPSLRTPHNAMPSFQNISAVTDETRSPLQHHPINEHAATTLHSLDTSGALPSHPSQTHVSPMSAGIARFHSPLDNTPTSATSVRSTAPLLPYNPAEYGRDKSGLSPIGSSPLLRGGGWSGDLKGRKKEERGSPVESRTLGTSFPPPPPRR